VTEDKGWGTSREGKPAIDYPILKHLKETFPNEEIHSKTVKLIDIQTYTRLQRLIKADIAKRFNNTIVPTRYDDIMWYRLNRENEIAQPIT